MKTAIQIVTTTENREDAERIARVLVEQRLVACAQIVGPILSIYRWKGNLEQAAEWQCQMKTAACLYDEVEAAIRAEHPYEVPEIVSLPILTGSRDYLDWLHEAVKVVR